jgi:hypothetical protein
MPLTKNYANKILDHIFGKQDLVRPSQLYLALFTDNPGNYNENYSSLELSGKNYKRTLIAQNNGNINYMNSAVDRAITNNR